MTDTDHLGTGDAAALLGGVDPTTVARWADTGVLPFFRTPGGHRRFRRADVERLARDMAEQKAVEPEDAA